jgi:hypothetical protein
MGPFLPLFSVNVRHSFFGAGACRGLSLLPTPATAALLQRAGCIVRQADASVSVFHDDSVLGTLFQRVRDAGSLEYHFHARSTDAWFASYTEGLQRDAASMLFFDSAAAAPADDQGLRRLHAGEFAGSNHRVPVDTPALQRGLSAQDRLAPPAFVLRIAVNDVPGAADAATWAAAQTNQRYEVQLQTRATRWRYYLPADWAGHAPHVVDLAGQAQFGPATTVHLDNGRQALSIRSLAPIPLADRPVQRFQLRTGPPPSDGILIKRLPVASTDQLHMETIDGVHTLVSEIYVNR